MRKAALKRMFVALIALSLIGGAMIQPALPAYALAPSALAATAASEPCDHAGMATDQQDQQPAQSMPCNSMACKGMLSDCVQMCFDSYAPLGLPIASNLTASDSYCSTQWPPQSVDVGLSIKPDPFPPRA